MISQSSRVHTPLALAAIALGLTALMVRPFTVGGTLVAMTAVGIIGVLGPVPPRREDHPGWAPWLGVTALGIAAFVAARALRSPVVGPVAPLSVALAALAAVAEEAFFRRLLYGWLAGAGAWVAVTSTAAAFAVVHVPAYGPGAIPIDIVAGLLFGWQRWASGGWGSSAVTHLMANLLQMR